jgi:hypothetical protein
MDVNPGSPFDVQVVQPLVRRLGTDPLTQDLSTFIASRMQQAFPDIANQEEDAVTDLLNKPATLLWDPIVREIIRVRQNLSFQDPTAMTVEEADALGANFFSTRKRGGLARGPARILFSAPQNVSVSPANFFTSKGGLHFFPTATQSIRMEEMILNVTTDGLYYFDINTIAEDSGTEYNIDPDELISVANIGSAVRVTNTRKFRSGLDEENAQQFISRVKQELTERSLVTLRGVAAKLVSGFPEINRLNVIGFNDPEMQRDIIRGGGLGSILAGGAQGVVVADGNGQALQTTFFTSEADFLVLTGGAGAVGGYVLTVFGAFGPTTPVLDLNVVRVRDTNTLEVDAPSMILGAANLRWTLRKQELTLSHIPGGILFPNTPNGEVTIKDNEVHVGGLYDTYVRGSGFDEDTFTIQNVTDDQPLLSGLTATVEVSADVDYLGTNVFQLNSLVEGVDFVEGDAVTQAIEDAVRFGYTLQVQDPPQAGVYRVLDYTVTPGQPLQLVVTPTPGAPTILNSRWRLFDDLNIDLLSPRETRVGGTDLSTLQNSDVVNVQAGTDFDALGVSEGDTLEILAGPSAGKYLVVEAPLSPTSVRLDTVLDDTSSSLGYTLYRGNEGALRPPFVRITKVELLDSSGQPLGTTIPYARPVDVQTRAFQNPARGVKWDLVDTRLGLVSDPVGAGYNTVGATSLQFYIAGAGTFTANVTSDSALSLSDIIDDLNTAFLGWGFAQAAVQVGTDRFGIRPVGAGGVVALVGGSARNNVFGGTELRTTGDIFSKTINDASGWSSLNPAIDFTSGFDVLQVLDGADIGFYSAPFTDNASVPGATDYSVLLVASGPITSIAGLSSIRKTFAPAVDRQVQVGSRSLGSARVFFLEPTSFEVDANSRFSLDLGTQGIVNFLPDPTLSYQKLPSLPANTAIQDGTSTSGGNTFSSASQDFILSGIQPDDQLVIDTMIIESTQVLADPVVKLAGKTLVFSLDGGPNRTAIFLTDSASLNAANGEVSRNGVIDQINAAAGDDIVELTGDNRIRFKTHRSLVVRGASDTVVGKSSSLVVATGYTPILEDIQGTAPLLSFNTTEDRNNRSPSAGTYTITDVGQTQLIVDSPISGLFGFPPLLTEQNFRVYRVGVQRISTTQMAENTAEAGMFYFDVELISEGAGDLYNVAEAQQLVPSGYRSDGYYLTTDDTNLTFSEAERPKMVISRSILETGVDDDPVNATQLTGENIEITYDRTQLVADVQGFLSSETERVICANPLSRHLIPYFVRLDVLYTGGSREDVVIRDLERYINDLAPVDTLDSSDVQKIVTDQGANYVKNPLDLIAVVHRIDRTLWVERSQDQLALDDRLSAFIPELLNVQRRTT